LLVGAALELVALDTLPFGASRYPEWGSAAVVGGAIFATHPTHPAGAIEMSIIASLTTAWVGGWTMVKLRERNAHWAEQRRAALDAGARGAVIDLQLRCMTADFVRGGLLAALSYALFAPLTTLMIQSWDTNARLSRAVVVTVAAAVAASAAWKIFHSVSGARWFFLGGLVVGLAVMKLL
jgi:PTS system mannose-specific IIC component